MTQAENEGVEALHARLLRPAPVDTALLVAVHRGLQAVPAAQPDTVEGSARPDAPKDRLARRRRG